MIAISILNIVNEKEKVKEVDNLGADYIHLDVMDGKFVEAKTDMRVLEKYASKVDLHLMVEDIDFYIELYRDYHPGYISFHIEATQDIPSYIEKIHAMGSKAGVAINPDTPVERLLPYLEQLDLVLVMSVVPGKGGQAFLPASEKKIEQLASLRQDRHYHYQIEVDGGVNDKTKECCQKADILVVGSYITKEENMAEKFYSMK